MKDDLREEFKVKIRNLVKNLCVRLSYDSLKQIFPKEHEGLLNYVNKHLVKNPNSTISRNNLTTDIEVDKPVSNKSKIDASFIDNADLDVDEEEEFISKEFKKTDKKSREDETMKLFEKIESLKLNEDPDAFKPKATVQVDKKSEAVERLFKTDKVDLVNHFYVNPYAAVSHRVELDKNRKIRPEKVEEEEKDVYFDEKKGKLRVSLDVKEKKEKMIKKRARAESDNEEDLNVKKMKTNKQSGHIIKYSGDEYKSKKGKGDVLVKGKADPFAYIQLNPKTTSKKNRKEGLKTFKAMMEKGKGSLVSGLKISK